MKRLSLLILTALCLITSCEKSELTPSDKEYTPEAVDDNSWTLDDMEEDAEIEGLNPKDSIFAGTLVYQLKSKYETYAMVNEDGMMSPKRYHRLLVRAVDNKHINIGLKDAKFLLSDGSALDLGTIVWKNVALDETYNHPQFRTSETFTAKDGKTLNINMIGSIQDKSVYIYLQVPFSCGEQQVEVLSLDTYRNEYPQASNGDFELWTFDDINLPDAWNSFQTSQGKYSAYMYSTVTKQVERSQDVRPGSRGRYSCLIKAKNVINLPVAGQLTSGRLMIGSMIPSSGENYAFTDRTGVAQNGTKTNPCSMAFVGRPDSVALWVRYIPVDTITTTKQTIRARFAAVIHDDSDYRMYASDANDTDENKSHIIAFATSVINPHDGVWQRISIPFTYISKADPKYILINVATCIQPSVCTAGDELYIDDIEMIYNHSKFSYVK